MRSFSLPWLIVVTACMLTADASCPFVEGAGQQTVPVSSALLRSARQASFDESCLGILLDRMKTKADRQQVDLVVELVETWSESHGFSMRLLSGISRLQAQRGDAETGKRIVALWEKRNKSFSAAVSEFSAAGRQGSADSLFRAVDRCMLLGPDALLRWARIKEVRGAFRQSAALHCRAMAGEPRIRSVALHQFSHLLENASRDSVRVALGELRRCIFSLPETDTSRMQQWIADAYARNGCDSEEIGVLTQFSPLSPSLVTRLLDIARIQYRRGNHSLAVIAARHCFDNAAEAHRMQTAAAVLCHAYDALGKADSSLYWVQRSDLSSEKGKIEAVALYQRRGRPADAEKLLHELRPSLARDTLAVRQRLFAGDIEGAGALVGTAAWNDHPREALLWKTRTLVFTARFDDLGPFFDTLRLDPAWENSKEL
ncbi:MAG: hypothetical protein JXA71_17795, partial [Chitinispirillaceae bacterium]|nr:hypothetical protein [Chitinispirillaceae bacterium]